ncbi:acyl carrier protein [Halalkalibacter urbisdiaboli]|uniref:acyl carrier protein n=1 Tax=Halalkalibacter urbisdiaboli TaxID=1960589 RepID=UPI000B432B8D|nr:phosphopantetheine-binding protein [Halalkalibacter urbisdiaboli]
MNEEILIEKIRDILTAYTPLKREDIQLDSHLTDELNLDSADLLELVMTAEEEFKIRIDDSVFEHVKTIRQIITTIKEAQIA